MTLALCMTAALLAVGCTSGKELLTFPDYGLELEANKAVALDDRLYFADETDTLYTWDEAREYCRLEDGELAKVTNRNLYNNFRSSVSKKGTYWIDGIETKDWFRFEMDMTCTPDNYFDLYNMNPENVDLRPNQCLALVKGDNARTSKIQAVDCNIPHHVLCARPLNGCEHQD